MNKFECHYLNTWPFGLDPRVKAHIVNKYNKVKARVLHIETKDVQLPPNQAIPILIKRKRGKTIMAIALFKNKRWFLTMDAIEVGHGNRD